MSLISSVPDLKEDERIDGDGLWSCLSFIIITEVHMQMDLKEREIDEYGGTME